MNRWTTGVLGLRSRCRQTRFRSPSGTRPARHPPRERLGRAASRLPPRRREHRSRPRFTGRRLGVEGDRGDAAPTFAGVRRQMPRGRDR
jgi:hypothetical protein